jgi:ABC-type branched-subunit amino acid transport system substrate-binding protein
VKYLQWVQYIKAIFFVSLSFICLISLHCSPPLLFTREGQEEFQKIQELYYQGQKDKALKEFKSFIQKFPQSAYRGEALYYMGVIYFEKNDPQRALVYFNQSLLYVSSTELQGQIYKLSGLGYYQLKDYSKAIEYYKKAWDIISTQEEKEEAKKFIARAQRKLIDQVLINTEIEKLIQLQDKEYLGKDVQGYISYRVAELYFTQGKYELASATLEKYKKLFPTHPYQTKADLLLKEIKEAIQSISQVIPNRLGCILPLSGKYGAIGQAILKGIKTAFLTAPILSEQEAYGLVVKDSGSISRKVINALEELATKEKVLIVIGPGLGEVSKTAAIIAAKHHLPLLSPAIIPQDLPPSNSYIFSIVPHTAEWGSLMADFVIKKLYLNSFAILYPYTPYGTQLQESFKNRVMQLGGKISKVISYQNASMDLAPQLKELEVQEDSKAYPQALFLPEDYYGLRLVIPQLAYYLKNQMLLLSCCYKEPPPLGDIEKKGLQGAIFITEFFPSSSEPKIQHFVSRFKKTFGTEPDYWAAQGYDAVSMIFHVLKSNQVQSREQMKNLLLGIRDFPGVTGKITILPNGGAKKVPFIVKIEGRQFIQLN